MYWFISPTYKQAKIQYLRMKKALRPLQARGMWHKNDSDLRVTFKNGSAIQFQSGEVYDNLRGETLNGVIIDEVRDQNPNLWPLVIRPMLTTTKGWAAFISTPRGFDHFYDFSLKAEADPKNWAFLSAPSTCNPAFTQEEYEQARQEMSEAMFAQEILAQFRDLTQGRAYPAFDKSKHVRLAPPWSVSDQFNPHAPIELYMDFNVHFLSWTYGQFREGAGHFFRGEIRLNSHTRDGALEFVSRFKQWGIKANPAVILVGDATGNASKTSASGETDYTIIKEVLRANHINYRDMTPASNPLVKDRVTTVNSRLLAADGHSEIFFHPDCKFAIKDFERVLWMENSERAILDQKSDASLTHSSDGIGYGICVRNPIKAVGSAGVLRQVRRA
ncbi:MAG: Terminase-like family protein [bacterium ADurb.BinA186]|nr:MAG: Terminase-like family protein [bacterium ADurb.BinA186]